MEAADDTPPRSAIRAMSCLKKRLRRWMAIRERGNRMKMSEMGNGLQQIRTMYMETDVS